MGGAQAVWNSSTRESGGLCVMTSGTCQKQTSSAGSWGVAGPCQPPVRPTLGKVLGRSSLTTCTAGETSHAWRSAPTSAGFPTTVGTEKMPA